MFKNEQKQEDLKNKIRLFIVFCIYPQLNKKRKLPPNTCSSYLIFIFAFIHVPYFLLVIEEHGYNMVDCYA